MLPKPNVVWTTCDWKADFEDKDYHDLEKEVPVGQFFTRGRITADDKVLIRGPKGFDAWLDRMRGKHGVPMSDDLVDYGDCYDLDDRKFKGLYWDGQELFALYDGNFYPWEIWEELNSGSED
jgi:hypothetical protein